MSKLKIFSKTKPRKEGDIQLKLVREDGEIVLRAYDHEGSEVPAGAIFHIQGGKILPYTHVNKTIGFELDALRRVLVTETF